MSAAKWMPSVEQYRSYRRWIRSPGHHGFLKSWKFVITNGDPYLGEGSDANYRKIFPTYHIYHYRYSIDCFLLLQSANLTLSGSFPETLFWSTLPLVDLLITALKQGFSGSSFSEQLFSNLFLFMLWISWPFPPKMAFKGSCKFLAAQRKFPITK